MPKSENISSAANLGGGASTAPSDATGEMSTLRLLRRMLGPILIEGEAYIKTRGTLALDPVMGIWTWLTRDIDPALNTFAQTAFAAGADAEAAVRFRDLLGQLINVKLREIETAADKRHDLMVQLGSDEALNALAPFQFVMSNQKAIFQAQQFGRALSKINDPHALAISIKSLPSANPELTPYLAVACISQVERPQQVVTAITTIAKGASAAQIQQVGLDAMIEAIFVQAQAQIATFQSAHDQIADFDLMCRALTRFHKLLRSVHPVVEDNPRLAWFQTQSKLISVMSDMVFKHVSNVDSAIRQALRPARSGADNVDHDAVLEALNGMYILCAAREARASLALNAVIEDAWTMTGQSIETLILRNIEQLRSRPHDTVLSERIAAATKLSSLRFSTQYADVYSKASETIQRGSAA